MVEQLFKPAESCLDDSALEVARRVAIAKPFATYADRHVLPHLIEVRLCKELLQRGMPPISYVQESGMRNRVTRFLAPIGIDVEPRFVYRLAPFPDRGMIRGLGHVKPDTQSQRAMGQ